MELRQEGRHFVSFHDRGLEALQEPGSKGGSRAGPARLPHLLHEPLEKAPPSDSPRQAQLVPKLLGSESGHSTPSSLSNPVPRQSHLLSQPND